MSSRQSPKLGSPTALFDGQKFNGSTGNGVFPVEDGKSFLAVRSTADLGDETHKLVLAQSS